MKCRTRKNLHAVVNRRAKVVSSKKIDPTQTSGLRRQLLAEIRKRFRLLRGRIVKLVVVEDAFGLLERKPLGNSNPEGCNQYTGPCSGGDRESISSEVGKWVGRLKSEEAIDALNHALEVFRESSDEENRDEHDFTSSRRLVEDAIDELEVRMEGFSRHLPGYRENQRAVKELRRLIGNVERIEMPQIRKENWEEFLTYAHEKTSLTEESGVDPKSLSAVQHEFDQERVDAIPLEKLQWPILISRDGYVLDGNHRWIKAYQTDHPLKVLRLGLDKDDALELMRGFDKAKFVENCGGVGGTPGPCPTLSQKVIGKIRGAYAKFSQRYGRRGAVAIMAAMAVTMPLPGNIFAVIGVAEGARYAVGKFTGNSTFDDLLADVRELAEELGMPFDEEAFTREYVKQVQMTENAFCPTGPGGGQDNSCSSSSIGKERIDHLASLTKDQLEKNPVNEMAYRADMGHSSVIAYWSDIDKKLFVGDSYFEHGEEDRRDIVAHEIGHGIVSRLSKDPELAQRVFFPMVATGVLGKWDDSKGRFVGIGGQRNPDEVLADLAKDYLTRPENLQQHRPRQYALIRDIINGKLPTFNRLMTNAGRFQFHSTPEKIRAFQDWLREQYASTLTGKSEEELWKRFAVEGYRRGAGRAWDDVRGAEFKRTHPEIYDSKRQESVRGFYQGTREEFLRSSFGRPETAEKLQLLASRSYADLENVTDDMVVRMGRTLMDGLARGANPREIGELLDDELDIGENRAETIARTEIIRAHAEGQLDSMEAMGVEEVGVAVEWSTAGDLRVCPSCSALGGIVLKTKESHGLIPRHPNCRCAFLPWLGEDTKDTKTTKAEIDDAVQESLDAEAEGRKEGFETGWVGADLEVDEDRPKGITNQEQIWEAIASQSESTNKEHT